MTRSLSIAFVLLLLCSAASGQTNDTPFYKVKYDSMADPALELQKAVAVAKESGKTYCSTSALNGASGAIVLMLSSSRTKTYRHSCLRTMCRSKST